MNYQPEDIDRLIAAQHEDENLEFKEAKNQMDTRELCKYCVALGNENGGKLILGVSRNIPRKVIGTNAFQNLNELKSQLLQILNFRVDVDEVNHQHGRVLIFTIPPRPAGTAYNYQGTYLMRVGESLCPMTDDMLRRIHDEGKGEYLLRPALTDASATDIQRLLDTHCYFDLMRLPIPTSIDPVLECFEQEQFISRSAAGWHITNLGALLFAKNLGDFDLQ